MLRFPEATRWRWQFTQVTSTSRTLGNLLRYGHPRLFSVTTGRSSTSLYTGWHYRLQTSAGHAAVLCDGGLPDAPPWAADYLVDHPLLSCTYGALATPIAFLFTSRFFGGFAIGVTPALNSTAVRKEIAGAGDAHAHRLGSD